MALVRYLALCFAILAVAYGRPPRQPKPAEHPDEKSHETSGKAGKDGGNGTAEWDLGIEYNRYLQEVVQVLESDPDFRKKLEDSDVEKIRDGSIAEELKFVNHNLRSKLDDVKRKEVDRLRKLAVKQYENNRGIDRQNLKMPVHIDVANHRFDVEDLRKLIKSTTTDLEEADKQRRTDFKTYEMEKKFENEERLRHIQDEDSRKKEHERIDQLKVKHKDHEKLNHPMTKDQLEEVWEDQDHMRAEDWDPKTFFAMHDLNGDGFWEEDELKVLFQKELDKAYDPNAPEDDMRERAEESERMREHVLKETDRNKDRMISLEEFLTQTKDDEFNRHENWEGLNENEEESEYTDDEFKQFEAQRNAEIQAMIAQGIVPPGYPYYGDVPPGAIPHPGAVPPPHGVNPQYQVPHPGVQGQQVHHPNFQQGQPIQGSVPVQNAYNPNQPAFNVNDGSRAQAGQPIHPNIQAGPVGQQIPSKDYQNFQLNQQVPQAPVQNAGLSSGGQFQQQSQGQQVPQNIQHQQQFQQPQFQQQQIRQDAPPRQFQNQEPVQQHLQQPPQKDNSNSQRIHTP